TTQRRPPLRPAKQSSRAYFSADWAAAAYFRPGLIASPGRKRLESSLPPLMAEGFDAGATGLVARAGAFFPKLPLPVGAGVGRVNPVATGFAFDCFFGAPFPPKSEESLRSTGGIELVVLPSFGSAICSRSAFCFASASCANVSEGAGGGVMLFCV